MVWDPFFAWVKVNHKRVYSRILVKVWCCCQWVNPIFPVQNKANPSSHFTPSRPSFKQLYNSGYHRIATACVWATLDRWRFLEVSFIHSRRRFLAPVWGCIHKLIFFNSIFYFYKPVGSTTLLAEVCSGRDVCGPTLKVHFKNGKKIYMRQTIGKLHWEMG